MADTTRVTQTTSGSGKKSDGTTIAGNITEQTTILSQSGQGWRRAEPSPSGLRSGS